MPAITNDRACTPKINQLTDRQALSSILDHYHYRRWYRTTTRTDFCCFHLQLNQYLTAFLQHHKYKERTASIGTYRKVTWPRAPPNAHNLQMRQLPCQYTYGQTRIRANTPTNTTPLLALYCHPNDPVAGTSDCIGLG